MDKILKCKCCNETKFTEVGTVTISGVYYKSYECSFCGTKNYVSASNIEINYQKQTP